jgi:HAD superfamily phosphatase (TIGR01668 family)
MLKRFVPFALATSIYDIDPSFFKKLGVTTLLTDLDNTLDGYRTKFPNEKAFELKKALGQAGITMYIASNNTSSRVREYCRELGVDYTASLYKPTCLKLKAWIRKKGLAKSKIMFVGDQLFTDVLAANGAGLRVVLTDKLTKSDSPFTWFNRHIEKPFRRKIVKKGLAKSWKEIKK